MYEIISSEVSLIDLTTLVNVKVLEGFVPVGNITFIDSSFIQAIFKPIV